MRRFGSVLFGLREGEAEGEMEGVDLEVICVVVVLVGQLNR